MSKPKYIDAKEFWNRLISVSENDWVGFDTIDEVLSEMPAADVIEVIRCKDCTKERTCNFAQYQGADGYCSYGVRKDG